MRTSKGRNLTTFGTFLKQVLELLPDYTSLTYRKVNLSNNQQNIYRRSLILGDTIKEPAFLSTSGSRAIAMLFPGNTFFIIHSKTGKDIEKIAKFGYQNIHNEQEVLFLPNTEFEVLEIDETIRNRSTIIMEEI